MQDRLGFKFPVTADREYRFYLYNAKEMSFIDRLDEIAGLGVSWVRLEAREKQPGYIKQVTGFYRQVLAALGTSKGKEVMAAAREAGELAPAGTTRGHYYRGVL